MIINESRKIDELINKYSERIKVSANEITTEDKRFYNNGLNAGKVEAYQEVIEDLKKLKEM